MASKHHRLMTPCHFQGFETDCERSRSYHSSNPCTHQRWGEFCADLVVQKQLDANQPRFVTETAIQTGYKEETHHETDLKFGWDTLIADTLVRLGFSLR